MASLIPGYEYDIFISYRQKDNRGERWVSEFVESLKTELESTFKEDISVYFDVNPHNGLLETHDVGASLKGKLNCLVFIPVISRTYCDPKSFAWEYEFKAFIETASQDQFGLMVKVPNGNVASRVLPVRIHDLDNEDIKLCESVLGVVLRGVEFIYKEPGVNRSLTTKDDERKNLKGTIYRNQVNKVALAIKEIISGLKGEPAGSGQVSIEINEPVKLPIQEKSIIVLPFKNMSPEADQEYFSDGLTEDITTDLSHIHDLFVISRSSAMTFKGSKKMISDIAKDVNVRYVLEGSVRKSGNDLRITAQLIDGESDTHIWAERYDGKLDNIFDIQEKVSRSIADALKLKISAEEKKKIHERPIDNAVAYDCYLRAYHELISWKNERMEFGLELLKKGLELTGENAVIYAGMAFAHFQFANIGIDQTLNINKAEEFVFKALSLDPGLAEAHLVYANLQFIIYGNPREAVVHYNLANLNKPDNPEIMLWLSWCYHLVGKSKEAIALFERISKIDPLNPMYNLSGAGLNNFMSGRFNEAMDPLLELYKLYSDASMWQLWKTLALVYNDRISETLEFLNENLKEPAQDSISGLLILLKYLLAGNKEMVNSLLTPDLVKTLKSDCQYSWHLASFYALLNEREQSLDWLENAVNRGFINYPMISQYDKLLNNVRGEERFKELIVRVKSEWENFKV